MRLTATLVWSMGLLALGCGGVGEAPGSTAGTGGKDGGTGTLVCSPSETQPCDCPSGGTGVATCNGSGSGFGACDGCDVAWSMRFDGAWSPAVRDDDHVYVATAAPGMPYSVGRAVRIAPSGDVVEDLPNDLFLWPTATSSGAAIFAGTVTNDGAFGGAALGVTQPSFAVARLDAAGNVGPAQAYTLDGLGLTSWDVGEHARTGTGAANDGRVAVEAPLRAPPYYGSFGRAVFVVSAQGEVLWSKAISGYWAIGTHGSVAVAPQGDVIAGAPVSGGLDFGSGPAPTVAAADGYVVRYGSSGDVLFHRQLAAASDTQVDRVLVAADPAGDAVVAVGATGTLDFGDGPVGTPGTWGAWLAKLGPNGEVLWQRAIDAIGPVAVGPDGDVWVCGLLVAGQEIDGQPATVAGSSDILLTRYDGSGTTVAHQQFAGSGTDLCEFVTVGASGIPVIAGRFQVSIDFGSGPLTALHGTDMFVARLGP
jgi:hypothetical protein